MYCELLTAERKNFFFQSDFYSSRKNLELDCSNTPREGLCVKEMYTSMEKESTTVTMDQSMKPDVFNFCIYLESLGKNYLTLLVLFIIRNAKRKERKIEHD